MNAGTSQGYNASKQLIFAGTPNRTSNTLSIAEVAAAGFLSGVPTSLVTAPIERAKVLLQVHSVNPNRAVDFKFNRLKGKGVLRLNTKVWQMC